VSTLTKRVYRKLKVRRRAEMVLRLRELGLG
jgi:DNA-binding CsgD family transcriptional regulator